MTDKKNEGIKTKQDRWAEKNGYISKSYKLKAKTVQRFAEACDKCDVSYSEKLQELMDDFIKDVGIEKKEEVDHEETG